MITHNIMGSTCCNCKTRWLPRFDPLRRRQCLSTSLSNVRKSNIRKAGHQHEKDNQNEIFFNYKKIVKKLKIEILQDSISSKLKTFPGVIIIGTKKGGTRGLIEFLNLHPSLQAAGPEVHFFDKRFRKGVAWYISRMPLVGPGQICMEKTPGNYIENIFIQLPIRWIKVVHCNQCDQKKSPNVHKTCPKMISPEK